MNDADIFAQLRQGRTLPTKPPFDPEFLQEMADDGILFQLPRMRGVTGQRVVTAARLLAMAKRAIGLLEAVEEDLKAAGNESAMARQAAPFFHMRRRTTLLRQAQRRYDLAWNKLNAIGAAVILG